MFKKIILSILSLIILGVVGVSLFFFRPWVWPGEAEGWRFYLVAFEDKRAEQFSHWETVQEIGTLKASSHPRNYERALLRVDDITYEFDGETYPITHFIEKAKLTGLMVLKNGDVRVEHYGGGINAKSKYHIWSATKSYTSTLMAMAHYEGVIDSLDDRVDKYAPQFKGTAYGETSIRHVAMMSSGIDFFHFKGTPDRNNMYWDTMVDQQGFDQWAAALPRRIPGVQILIISPPTLRFYPRSFAVLTGSPLLTSCRKKYGNPVVLPAMPLGAWIRATSQWGIVVFR